MNEVNFNIDDIRFELSCASDNLTVVVNALNDYSPVTKELNMLIGSLLFTARGIEKISKKVDVLTGFDSLNNYDIT